MGQICMDQTGRFITASSTEKKPSFSLQLWQQLYPCQAHEEQNYQGSPAAYQQAPQILVHIGLCPKLECLDNECSTILKDFILFRPGAIQQGVGISQLVTTDFRASIQTDRQLIYRYQTVIAGCLHYDDASLVPQQCSWKMRRPLGLDGRWHSHHRQ